MLINCQGLCPVVIFAHVRRVYEIVTESAITETSVTSYICQLKPDLDPQPTCGFASCDLQRDPKMAGILVPEFKRSQQYVKIM